MNIIECVSCNNCEYSIANNELDHATENGFCDRCQVLDDVTHDIKTDLESCQGYYDGKIVRPGKLTLRDSSDSLLEIVISHAISRP